MLEYSGAIRLGPLRVPQKTLNAYDLEKCDSRRLRKNGSREDKTTSGPLPLFHASSFSRLQTYVFQSVPLTCPTCPIKIIAINGQVFPK